VTSQLALLDAGLRDSAVGEYVATPPWFVNAILATADLRPWNRRILDAGAGLGEIGWAVARWSREWGQEKPLLTGLELFPDRVAALPRGVYREVIQEDLLDWVDGRKWPLILTNPPFSLWKQWLDALRPQLSSGGSLFCVLPWEYCSRAEAWWRAHPARRIYRTARRPWKVETREVCWVEFRSAWTGQTSLRWLDR